MGDYLGMEEQYGGQQEDCQWGYIKAWRNSMMCREGLICKLGGYDRAIVYERGRHCNLGHICKLGGYGRAIALFP